MIGATDRLISAQLNKWMTKARGKFVFVDGGSTGPTHNKNDGLSPYTPKQTFTDVASGSGALSLLDNEADDVLFVINYGSNGRVAEAANFPIIVSKNIIHIIGLQSMDNSKWPTVKPNAGDTHCFDITGQRVEMAQLEVGGGATKAAIHVGSVGGIWAACLHDIWFGITGDTAGQDGVRVDATEDAPFLEVYDCRFGNALTRHGIYINGNATRGILGKQGHGNKFLKVPNIAMNISGPVGLDEIVDNLFSLPSDTVGYAITMSATSSGALVSGNKASFKIAGMTNNPFRDLSNANHWIDNWRQGLTIAPDIV
jgi:hypothetical protein